MLAELEAALERRRDEGLTRMRRVVASPQDRRIRVADRDYLAFASNDYLGLANSPALIDALCDAAREWGTGAGASHMIVGHQQPHEALERELAAFVAPCDNARALLLSSGYLANLAILTALAGRNDAIFADRLNHACLTDGALLSRASLSRYPHCNVDALRASLTANHGRRRFIVTDAVFSMDGDVAPLAELVSIAEDHDAWLVVDDAHGFGVHGGGRGTLAELGIASERIVYMGTLGKAAGVSGAFVAAHPLVIETLVQTARPYIYTTASPAALAQALRCALRLVREGDQLRAHLVALIAAFRARARAWPWKLGDSSTPIQPIIVGDAAEAMRISEALADRGILVPAIRPPTVPVGTSRLRVSLSAAHTLQDVSSLADALDEIARAHPNPLPDGEREPSAREAGGG
ncbi:MAG TPA: 8-amino-7-oxononanoate synthase [Casimicrobiaceae bacterium]|nr:8-amino-7-oxononanoate synthase [Casimicrobiaceae bacterium]